MEVTIAMGHFCDSHGPCVILCTDRSKVIPEKTPASLDVPVCSACRSIDFDTVFTCQDEDNYYVSTRTSLDKTMASLLKDAILRSFSVEVVQEQNKSSGTVYFGDDKRGHVISHVFDIKDSLARGFKRKYCIIVLGKHQIPLLHHYNFIEKNLKQISLELQEKADSVNANEQLEKSQREVRQTQGYTKALQRSLSELVGEQYVFAQVHMWFVFLLRAEIFKSIPHNVPECPVDCSKAKELRILRSKMPENVFKTIVYCVLTGIRVVEEKDTNIMKHFYQLLPKGFVLPTTGNLCRLSRSADGWEVYFKGCIPKHKPTLLVLIEKALSNENLPDAALPHHLMSLVIRWFNIASVLSWAPSRCDLLMQSLEIRQCDMPLLSYWIPQSNSCVKLCENDWLERANIDHVI